MPTTPVFTLLLEKVSKLSESFLMSEKLKIGFIGGSLCSAVGNAHAVACQLQGTWELVSGCFSRDVTKSRATAERWAIPTTKTYTDWKQYVLCEKNELDAIVVLTPTPDHEEIVCHLLAEGVAVICEKAMASNLSQSNKIKAAIDQHNGFLAVTFNYTGYPMLRVLREHVAKGDLGKLTQIQIEMPSDGFIQDPTKMKPQQWRLSDGEIPTLLLDLAVHIHHITGFVSGLKPQSVNADFHHDSIFNGIIDDAYLWVKYEQGFRASMWVSKSALGYRNGLKVRLFGEKASAEWYQEEPEKLVIYSKNSAKTVYDRGNCLYPREIRESFKPGHPGGFVEAFANLYADIASEIVNKDKLNNLGSKYVYGWKHADEGLRLLTAAVLSNEQKGWVNVE